jgi:hypothetical protein
LVLPGVAGQGHPLSLAEERMAVMVDGAGNRWTMLDCPRCDKPGPHANAGLGNSDVFECDRCFAPMTDQDGPSGWLPS